MEARVCIAEDECLIEWFDGPGTAKVVLSFEGGKLPARSLRQSHPVSEERDVREWLVIENSWKNAVFAPDDARVPRGYIPRDVVELLLGKKIEDDRATWFTKEDDANMRAHPEWRNTEPDWSPLGFWSN